MKGGEIFIQKIPSMRIIDLAEVIAPGIEKKVIGISRCRDFNQRKAVPVFLSSLWGWTGKEAA